MAAACRASISRCESFHPLSGNTFTNKLIVNLYVQWNFPQRKIQLVSIEQCHKIARPMRHWRCYYRPTGYTCSYDSRCWGKKDCCVPFGSWTPRDPQINRDDVWYFQEEAFQEYIIQFINNHSYMSRRRRSYSAPNRGGVVINYKRYVPVHCFVVVQFSCSICS